MKKILLIVSGGIAAYRSLDLIREIKRRGDDVTCVLTKSATKFVQPLSFASLSQNKVYTDLFDIENESKIGHIKLSRDADLIVLAPATANILAKMVHGVSDSLATSILLANNKPLLIAPSMNVKMWNNPATIENIKSLKNNGHIFVGPDDGEMACGEVGSGKMSKVEEIYKEISYLINSAPLKGKKALVTSGPTIEPIDPVRFISNRSSGKQGHAIASLLSKLGAETHLITGPVNIPYPDNVKVTEINTANEMLNACMSSLPVDISIFAAAVSDWKVVNQSSKKIKKSKNKNNDMNILLEQNPDILKLSLIHI